MDYNNLKPRDILMDMGTRWWTAADVHERYPAPTLSTVVSCLSWLHEHGYVDTDDSTPRRYQRTGKIWPAGRGD